MKRPPYPSTPKQAKAWFKRNGICISEWCLAHGFNRYTVFDLLRGKRKGARGEAHEAAVLLGIKEDPNQQNQQAA